MNITFRQYGRPGDFESVGNFLVQHFRPGNQDGNWLQPTWEYMHSHPALNESSLEKIGIWEDSGEITGVVHYESRLGEAFFEIHPGYSHLKPAMLEYAETHLYGETKDGRRYVRAYVNDFDEAFAAIVKSRGYEKDERYTRPISQFVIPHPFPPIDLPEGFRLQSLADDNDLVKVHRVLWRGFDNAGEPPAEGIEGRKKMQSGPNFCQDLTIVVQSPQGDFVSFCGTWYESTNKIAYVEPVATDPEYRRMGLGKAAVREGIRRCGILGATVAFVGSDLEFYRAIGFEKRFDSDCWTKHLDL